MNTTQTEHTNKNRSWLRGPLLFATALLVLLTLCLGMAGLAEKRAGDRVRAELARVRGLGYAVDDESMHRWFSEHTSDEETREWHDIHRYVFTTSYGIVDNDDLPYVGNGEIPDEIAPEGDWSDERAVAEYLSTMRPVIEQIHQIGHGPEPVWQPIEFRGYATLLEELQESRQVMRLLQLDVEHAIYHRDPERALRGLESMRKLADAFDWSFCMVGEMVQIALREQHYQMIRRSLAADLWNAEQLARLADQLGPPRDLAARWMHMIAGERALMLASLGNPEFLEASGAPAIVTASLLRLPSVRDRLLSRYREMEALATDDIQTLAPHARQLDQSWWQGDDPSRPLILLPGSIDLLWLPAVGGMAQAMANEETSRRFSRTALAIKQFQLREGRWPDSLAELSKVGLPVVDQQTVSGGPFGYEVMGDQTYLWSYDPATQQHVSTTRPRGEAEKDSVPSIVTLIR